MQGDFSLALRCLCGVFHTLANLSPPH
jgi:hypothetical protein